MLKEYLSDVFKKFATGDATERTYYPLLENLLVNISSEIGDYSIIIEGKNSSVGIPDFKIKDSKDLLIGYIEAKDLGRDLDRLSSKENEQIDKYINEYEKLIVTNFIEFRFYENHELIDSVQITQPVTLELNRPIPQNEAHLSSLLERFFYNPIQQIYTAKRLSELLAGKTKRLKDLIYEEIDLEDEVTTKTEEIYDTFKKTLNPDMKPQAFADMYAQTITFGLFVARINSKEEIFNRFSAYKYIPKTIPLLKEIFKVLSWQDLPSHIEWYADEIAEILAYTNIDKISSEFFSEGKGRDPIIHFYETFLADYDPKEREKRGVYYTPQQVVSYITRSIHELLKEKFGITDGFADPSVRVLDPAGGTLTFPAEAIALAKDEYVKKNGDGAWKNLVKNHILKNFYAFELLMAPYAIGHLKISLLLKELGYEMDDYDRFKLYLTNTLDFNEVENLPLLMLMNEITEESKLAYEVKTKEKILVIMGNPPYSVSSSNKILANTEFSDLYESYKENVRKEERNIQPLSDDYIKFIAFAHWKIRQAKQGIVGMITNNSYLDGLIHRDMRKKLLEDFSEIYILNLHGNSRIKEKTPQGELDENVFDIQQGVSIVLLVKTNNRKSELANTFYNELWGKREEKYDYLENNLCQDKQFEKLKILQFENKFKLTRWSKHFSHGLHLFSLKEEKNIIKYGDFYGLGDLFKNFNAGVATGKDDVLVSLNKDSFTKKLSIKDKTSFNILMEQAGVENNIRDKWYEELNKNNIENQIKRYSYRPFDARYTIYNSKILQRSRRVIMDHFLSSNISIAVTKSSVQEAYNEVFVSDSITDKHLTGQQTYVFPLYLYKVSEQTSLLDNLSKSSNINLENLPQVISNNYPSRSKISGNSIQIEEAFFYYIYAILYSNIYREKYHEFLKIDFPRIPITNDYNLFKLLAELGEKLVLLHLLKAKELDTPLSKFNEEGDAKVEKVKYENKRIYINNFQYFDQVEPDIWNYYIGGYQVLDKWLKPRKGSPLSFEDALHFRKIITSIARTIEVQKKIDSLYPEAEKTSTK